MSTVTRFRTALLFTLVAGLALGYACGSAPPATAQSRSTHDTLDSYGPGRVEVYDLQHVCLYVYVPRFSDTGGSVSAVPKSALDGSLGGPAGNRCR